MPSLFDILPPEAQHLLGSASLIIAVVGLLLWASGVKIARLSVAIFLGVLGCAAGWSQLPADLGITPVTAALVGFAVGALVGALAFKILQGLVLALCVGLAAAGIFYQWHTTSSAPTVQVAHNQPAATHPAEPQLAKTVGEAEETPTPRPSILKAKDLEIPTFLLSQKSPAQTAPAAQSSPLVIMYQKLTAHWHALPMYDQRPLLVISLSAAIATLLMAFSFPRQATWLASAFLGALLLYLGLHTAAKIYYPQYEMYFPATPLSRYIALLLVACVGLLIQYTCFWPSTRPKPLPKVDDLLHRAPKPA